MKKNIIGILAVLLFSCQSENEVKDPVYEFVSFKGSSSINLNELQNSTSAKKVIIQLLAFAPYNEDIDIGLEVTPTNSAEGTDFTVTPATSVKIPAGSLTSDTIYLKTIDNNAGSLEPRKFDLKIVSVSKADIKIGLGIAEPKNASITVNILDDECSNTTDIFNSNSLTTSVDWGSGGEDTPATGSVSDDDLTVTGDLIGYGPFSGAHLTITLTPNSPGATKGTATFGEQETGSDSDGYDYKFIQTGDGVYDVCDGTVSVAYDIYYMDGGWVYWYSVTNVYAAP